MDSSENEEAQRSPIERLPVELLRIVFSDLPDIASLQATVLSCTTFYRAFIEAETTITAEVLSAQIDFSVLPDAVTASESSFLHPHAKDASSPEATAKRLAVGNFVHQNLRHRPSPPQVWTLAKAQHVGQLDVYVSWFADLFTKATLTKSPFIVSPATFQEVCRIKRSFYRFETFCNLFREVDKVLSVVHEDRKTCFFQTLAPWEIEQLGCVHDFLVEAISPAFVDIAEHDVAWGANCVDYESVVDSPFLQHLLSLGLRKLHQIVQATTYQERYDLLCSGDYPSGTRTFLHEGLQDDANDHAIDIYLNDLTPENEVLYIRQPLFVDSDPGPKDTWRWAHHDSPRSSWVYQDDRDDLRRWGYVMWDRFRLEGAGIYQKPWETVCQSRDRLQEEQEAGRRRAYMENSWDQREKIYRRGGVGYWTWGDDSKVQWERTVPSPQRPSVPRLAKPGSLEEAREMLSMMRLPSSIR